MSINSPAVDELSFDGGTPRLRCLSCGRGVRFEELGGLAANARDEVYFDCPDCRARNEVRAGPQPGLGMQPRAFVVRLLETPKP